MGRGIWACLLLCMAGAAQAQESPKFRPMDQFTVRHLGPPPPPARPNKSAENLALCSGELASIDPEFPSEEENQTADELLRLALANGRPEQAEELRRLRSDVISKRNSQLASPKSDDLEEIARGHVSKIETLRVCFATIDLLKAEGAWKAK